MRLTVLKIARTVMTLYAQKFVISEKKKLCTALNISFGGQNCKGLKLAADLQGLC
jgi:hypothetical protein